MADESPFTPAIKALARDLAQELVPLLRDALAASPPTPRRPRRAPSRRRS